jgi:hypothetical protein
MTYEIIKNYPQRFKALTCYDVKRFNELLIFFKVVLNHYFEVDTFNGKIETPNIHPKPINSHSLRLTNFFYT